MLSKTLCLSACLLYAGFACAQNVPRSSHVWVINEENHGYEEIVGNSQMPYYNKLIQEYGLATQFYSDRHTSLPALMWFVAGASVETNEDTVSCQHSEDNVVRELLKKGYSWRSYQEDLPYAGYEGLYSNLYWRRHNPLIDFTDVCPGTGQDKNIVPYTQMAADYSADKVVNYAWITPDVNDDSHNGTLAGADQWLQDHVPDILARPEFGPGGDGILFIVWDESELTGDNRCSATVTQGCGGHTANLVIGPQVKSDYKSTILYHNENVLSTVCAAMGLATCPGAGAKAAPMADFFKGTSTGGGGNGVVISSPGGGATVGGAVRLIASATEDQTISQTQVWDNGKKLGVYGSQIDAIYNLTEGNHTTTVVDLDTSYKPIHQSSITYTVQSAGAGGLQVISPSPAETFSGTTVHVVAQASESVPVSQMQVWDNGVKLGHYDSTSVNQYFNLALGSHTLTVTDLDSNYNVIHKSSVSYSVQ
jgi:acid phosphatase